MSLWIMEGQQQQQQQNSRSRVVKVNSEQSWNTFVSQAKDQGCPVSLLMAQFLPSCLLFRAFPALQVFVHFGASWCVPSLAMNAFFEELAVAYPDILFLSVDVDEAKEVASRMGVKAMPTFVLMRDDGAVIDRAVGANPEEIRKRVDGFVQSFRSSKILE